MPTVTMNGTEYMTVDTAEILAEDAIVEGPEIININFASYMPGGGSSTEWDDAIVWYYGHQKPERIAKNLREALGEPDWEI